MPTMIVDGERVTITQAQANALFVTPPITSDDVDRERDRRKAAGFTWNGVFYQTRPQDIDNIGDMAQAAMAQITRGVTDGRLNWLDDAKDFYWIAADNSHVPMSADDMVEFGLAAARKISGIVLAANILKTAPGGIPSDYLSDARWP